MPKRFDKVESFGPHNSQLGHARKEYAHAARCRIGKRLALQRAQEVSKIEVSDERAPDLSRRLVERHKPVDVLSREGC